MHFKGSSQIEIIYLEFPLSEKEVIEWKGDELKKMQNLKTLIVKNGRFSKGPKHLPNSLRVLEWPKYPARVIPSDFCPKKLSICKLQQSDFISFELHGTMKVCVNVMIFFPRQGWPRVRAKGTAAQEAIFLETKKFILYICILNENFILFKIFGNKIIGAI
jgi:hypothetical protein